MNIKVRSYEEFVREIDKLNKCYEYEKLLSEICHKEGTPYTIPGFCTHCNENVLYPIDFEYSDGRLPNYRERLVCPLCHLNNRQRIIVTAVKKMVNATDNIFIYEYVTPIFSEIKNFHDNLVGSEYFGPDFISGTEVDGIQHQNAENLSFDDHTFDFILSNDILEHVMDYKKAIRESHRVLKKNGKMLITIPFYHSEKNSRKRVEMINGDLVYIESPQYHGNPVSHEGSLVINDFGWDFLTEFINAGFSDIYAVIVYSVRNGNIGMTPWKDVLGAPIYFIAEK